MVFYNEAAGALLGRSFEDAGRMSPEEWISTFGPFDEDGKPIPLDDLPITQAVREGRPAHGVFRIRSAGGTEHEIESSTFPIVASEEGSSGAMILFWPLDANARRGGAAMKVKVWGARGSVPVPGAEDEPLRRQHLLRAAHPRRAART